MSVDCKFEFISHNSHESHIVTIVIQSSLRDIERVGTMKELKKLVQEAFQKWKVYQQGRIPEGTKGLYFSKPFEEQILEIWLENTRQSFWHQLFTFLRIRHESKGLDPPSFVVRQVTIVPCMDQKCAQQRQVRSG